MATFITLPSKNNELMSGSSIKLEQAVGSHRNDFSVSLVGTQGNNHQDKEVWKDN